MSSMEPLTQEEELRLEKLLSNPLFFPKVFQDWVSEKVRSEVTPELPFSQVLKSDTLKGSLNLFGAVSPSFPAFGTWKGVGTITIPGPCKAMIFFMSSSYNWAGDYGKLGLEVNGAAVDENQVIWMRGNLKRVFGARAQYVTLPNESNTVRLMCMKIGSGDVDFQDLGIAVFRIFGTA
jgi:hypothetical protein